MVRNHNDDFEVMEFSKYLFLEIAPHQLKSSFSRQYANIEKRIAHITHALNRLLSTCGTHMEVTAWIAVCHVNRPIFTGYSAKPFFIIGPSPLITYMEHCGKTRCSTIATRR